jgi:ABC-type glutathione transport system ATPase component
MADAVCQESEPDREPPLLAVRDLSVRFPVRGSAFASRGWTTVLNGVNLDVPRGGALGIVGESGSGKTTLGRAILRLQTAWRGSVRFDGTDVLTAQGPTLKSLRRRMQIIFQDPGGSLNPRMRIGAIVGEPLVVHAICKDREERLRRVGSLLGRVGLESEAAARWAHEFSGGQRQRIMIARALATEPELLVCDEPTSALDVSVQAQIINLLSDLREQLGLSMLFISHDIAVVAHMCETIAVMKDGRIIERGSRERVLDSPHEGYTRALLEAVPEARVR